MCICSTYINHTDIERANIYCSNTDCLDILDILCARINCANFDLPDIDLDNADYANINQANMGIGKLVFVQGSLLCCAYSRIYMNTVMVGVGAGPKLLYNGMTTQIQTRSEMQPREAGRRQTQA